MASKRSKASARSCASRKMEWALSSASSRNTRASSSTNCSRDVEAIGEGAGQRRKVEREAGRQEHVGRRALPREHHVCKVSNSEPKRERGRAEERRTTERRAQSLRKHVHRDG